VLPVAIAVGAVPALKISKTDIRSGAYKLGLADMNLQTMGKSDEVDRFWREFVECDDGARSTSMRSIHDFYGVV
jgi:hypothetical protein